MSDDIFKNFDKTLNTFNDVLNLRTLNQNIINANIANSETPNYHPKMINFQRELDKIIGRSNGESTSDRETEIINDPDAVIRLDGNGVNIEKEMSKMIENSVMYTATVKLLTKRMEMIKRIIMAADEV